MKAFYNGKIFNGDRILSGMAVLTEGNKVVSIVEENAIPTAAERIDLKDNYLAPALIDLQIYGGHGKLFSLLLSPEALQSTYEYCLSGGCTEFLITLATNSIEKFLKGIEAVKEYWQQGGKGLLGLHLEGPYINPEKRGAHLTQYIKKPTTEEIKMLLEKGRDVIKMMTLAPEQCSDESIQLLQNNGVVVSAGHSNATYQQGTDAFNKGITVCTHLFNAMSPLQHRAPGLPGAIFDHPSVMTSIVPDGIHVAFPVARMSKKLLQHRLFIITDAVADTTEGEYPHVFKEDRYTLPDGTLSGSALTMMKGVKNCVEFLGASLEEGLRMASLYPATVINKEKEFGRIEKGYKAEFVIFNKELEIERV